MTVADLMHEKDLPVVLESTNLQQTIVEISKKAFGCAIIVNTSGRMTGIITDGDLRRTFEKSANPLLDSVCQHMNRTPTVVSSEILAAEALQQMEDAGITVLPVVKEEKVPIGILHLHDLVRAGMA